jgi:hypothetical protein
MENKSLITIVNESASIEAMLIESGGELTDEIQNFLSVNASELATKVDGYHMIIDRFDSLKKYYAEKAEFFKTISIQCDNASKRLKENIKFAMIEMNVDEIKGHDMRFKLSNGAGKLVIDDSEMVPVEFKEEKTETIIKSADLKEALKKGPVVGAHIEATQSVRAYANLPEKKSKQLTKGGSDE